MRSLFTSFLITSLATGVCLVAGAAAAEDEGKAKPRPPRPTPPYIQACQGLSEGDECSFTRGKKKHSGKCTSRKERLRCIREQPRPNRNRPPHAKQAPKAPKAPPAPTPEAPSAE